MDEKVFRSFLCIHQWSLFVQIPVDDCQQVSVHTICSQHSQHHRTLLNAFRMSRKINSGICLFLLVHSPSHHVVNNINSRAPLDEAVLIVWETIGELYLLLPYSSSKHPFLQFSYWINKTYRFIILILLHPVSKFRDQDKPWNFPVVGEVCPSNSHVQHLQQGLGIAICHRPFFLLPTPASQKNLRFSFYWYFSLPTANLIFFIANCNFPRENLSILSLRISVHFWTQKRDNIALFGCLLPNFLVAIWEPLPQGSKSKSEINLFQASDFAFLIAALRFLPSGFVLCLSQVILFI